MGHSPRLVMPAPVGVVFVHGIGSQSQSSTLREFAAPLLEYLREWHAARGMPDWQPDAAELSYGGMLNGPARVFLGIPSHTQGDTTWPARRFIFAEAWWAARLDPPPLDRMIAWSARTLWRVIRTLFAQMSRRIQFLVGRGGSSASDPGPLAALGEVLSAVGFIVAYVVAAILGYVVLLPLLVLAHIPIREVQEFVLVKMLKPFLVENIGDFATYIDDEVQALNIRTAVGDAIRSLVDLGCEDVCVVAHSQGALVAFDGVCAVGRQDPAAAAHIRKLITFGGALNRAFAEPGCPPRLRGTLPSHIFWLDVWSQYDPVAGGYLRRPPGAAPLVNPSPELRQRMGWSDRFDGPLPDQVTNSMNPLLDHGGYFHNPEQFVNRVLAEVEDPSAYYKTSRFFFRGDAPRSSDARRVYRRRTRISALAWWRLWAIGTLGVTLLWRGAARLGADGAGLSAQLAAVPGHELVTAPGKLFDGLGMVLDALASRLVALGALAGTIDAIRTWWSGTAWGDLILASLVLAAAFAALYWILLRTLYRPWDERERREAVAETLPPDRLRPLTSLARSLAVIGAFVLATLIAVGR